MMFRIDTKDFRQTMHRLEKLEPKLARKVLRRALRAGAKQVCTAAKSKAQTVVGGEMGSTIASYIKPRSMRRMRRFSYGVAAEISAKGNEIFSGVTADGNHYYIPAAIEYGHAAPGQAGGPKVVPAMPFMRPAWDETKGRVLTTIKSMIASGIDEAAK